MRSDVSADVVDLARLLVHGVSGVSVSGSMQGTTEQNETKLCSYGPVGSCTFANRTYSHVLPSIMLAYGVRISYPSQEASVCVCFCYPWSYYCLAFPSVLSYVLLCACSHCQSQQRPTLRGRMSKQSGQIKAYVRHTCGIGHDHPYHHAGPAKRGRRQQEQSRRRWSAAGPLLAFEAIT